MGNIHRIKIYLFPKLSKLDLTDGMNPGWWTFLDRIKDVSETMLPKHHLKKRVVPILFESRRRTRSFESRDWFVPAGPSIGWRWTNCVRSMVASVNNISLILSLHKKDKDYDKYARELKQNVSPTPTKSRGALSEKSWGSIGSYTHNVFLLASNMVVIYDPLPRSFGSKSVSQNANMNTLPVTKTITFIY